MKKSYVVAGWASVNEGTEGPAIYSLMEDYISQQGTISMKNNTAVKVL